MGSARRFAAFVIFAVVALAAGYAGWRVCRLTVPEQCYACRRAVHPHTRTIALANGKPQVFCCPACALSEQAQKGRPVRVTELTAFLTGARLSPNEAYVVRASDVNMCARQDRLLDADQRVADLSYDRCMPSLLAFAHAVEAIQFSREHGGTVLPFREVQSTAVKKPVRL